MRKPSFTPKPWVCYADLPSSEPNWHKITNGSRMRMIANVHIEPGNEMDMANAAVLTAAPWLYDALATVLHDVEQGAMPEIEPIRLALAQAEPGYRPRANPYDKDGNFVGYDTAVIGMPDLRLSHQGAHFEHRCCNRPDVWEANTEEGKVRGCNNCGTKSVDGFFVRGMSMGCPRRHHHHLGSTCSVCGQKD